ncbi:MAG: UbiA-like polyprenyltransferase [Pirellulaceae bacterium]
MNGWNKFRQILEMIRFSHTLFALPFALLAAIMAWVAPSATPVRFHWLHLVGILLAMVGARSAAMAFNRLVDRRIDADNPRTATRHLPAGKLSVASVWLFTIVSTAVYLAGASLFLPNYLPLVIALPVLAVLLMYSYTKRFTALAHFWLGLALALAPICAWIAIRGLQVIADPSDLTPALLLGLAVMFWVAGFDMIYACQDFEFDRQAGLKSIPVLLGVAGALRLAALCHAVMIGLLCLIPVSPWIGGPELGLSWLFGCSLAAIAGLLVYEHRLVSPTDLSRVNLAFFNVNAVVSIGLLVIGFFDLLYI